MKSLYSLILAICFVASSFAQSVEVPQMAMDHFNGQLSGTSVHWTQSNDQILGQFKNNGNPAGMRYELDGTFVRKETKLQISNLPQILQDHLTENGVMESVISAFKLENTNVQYLLNIGGTDHLFDENAALMGTYNTPPFNW